MKNHAGGKKARVVVALSGGVDSSTSAAILLERGYDCSGVFMITNDRAHHAQRDAEEVARKLGIELDILDLRGDFEQIIEYFCVEYRKGRTPNPCVLCNRLIKFGRLLAYAKDKGAELFSTGHYARVLGRGDQRGLYEAACGAKDQSYVLSMINREVLGHLILPMGDYSKEQTREMAKEFGLETAEKRDSQEICFIPDDDYIALLEQRCPELSRKGDIVDSNGKVLGEHNGVHRFTIGQRKGLGVAMGKPYYVTKINAEDNTVTLGPKEEVMHRKLWAGGVNWLIDRPESAFRAKVKIRYNSPGAAATVTARGEVVIVEFDEPNLAVTAGQLAVFYVGEGDKSRIAGAGWIDKAARE